MCGRFTLRTPARDLVEIFELLHEPELSPRYNIAPTQNVAVIRQDGKSRELSMMRWGLVPAWSKDPKAVPPLINARAETFATIRELPGEFEKLLPELRRNARPNLYELLQISVIC